MIYLSGECNIFDYRTVLTPVRRRKLMGKEERSLLPPLSSVSAVRLFETPVQHPYNSCFFLRFKSSRLEGKCPLFVLFPAENSSRRNVCLLPACLVFRYLPPNGFWKPPWHCFDQPIRARPRVGDGRRVGEVAGREEGHNTRLPLPAQGAMSGVCVWGGGRKHNRSEDVLHENV